MELYIDSTGIVCGAGYNTDENFLVAQPDYETDILPGIEPDYKQYIPLMQLRRMSKGVRMSIGAAKICMSGAGIDKPDAIAVGTSLGCVHDSGVFLSKMVYQDEEMLTPTSFIQSTHNTVAGQIALLYGCTGPNLTYTHRGHSFEHTMISAALYLGEHPGKHVLAGGVEEVTDLSSAVLKRAQIYTKSDVTPGKVLNEYGQGSIGGEGSCFFMVSDKPAGDKRICIRDIAVFKGNAEEAKEKVQQFLQYNSLDATNTDLAIVGINGDIKSKDFYEAMRNDVFKGIPQAAFKHLCGEYATSSSFALGMLADAVMKNRPLPEVAMLSGHAPEKLQHVVIINSYMQHYSCWHIAIS